MQLLRKKGLLDSPRVLFLPVDAISPNPNQPRRVFGTQELEELAGSIQALGLLQPLTVRRRADGWELVAGERRLRAAKLAGLEEVPCISLQIDDQRSSLLALVENLQRKDLDFWEEALALDRLISVYHLSQEEAARRIGKSQSAVANKLRLLKLPEDTLRALRDGGCTERHARALLRLEDPSLRQKALEQILSRQLTVAQTDALVDQLLSPPPRTRTKRMPAVTARIRMERSCSPSVFPRPFGKNVSRETFSFPISPSLPIACRSQITWRQTRSRLSPSVCTSPFAAGRPCAVRRLFSLPGRKNRKKS